MMWYQFMGWKVGLPWTVKQEQMTTEVHVILVVRVKVSTTNKLFHKTAKIGSNGNIGITGFTMCNHNM